MTPLMTNHKFTRRTLFGAIPLPFLLGARSEAPSKRIKVQRVPTPVLPTAIAPPPWLPAPEDVNVFWSDFYGHSVYATNWMCFWPFGERPWPIQRYSARAVAGGGSILLAHAFLLWGQRESTVGYIEKVLAGFSVERTRAYDNKKFLLTVSDKMYNRGARQDTGATHWEQVELSR
jgi:hypothetical protein